MMMTPCIGCIPSRILRDTEAKGPNTASESLKLLHKEGNISAGL